MQVIAVSADDTFTYQLPANVQDFELGSEKDKALKALWNDNMTAFTRQAIIGNPWTRNNDAPRNNYLDPATTKSANEIIHPVTWTAIPNRVIWYFHSSQNNPYQLSRTLVYPLIDDGRLDVNSLALKQWVKIHNLDDELRALLKRYPEFGNMDTDNFAPVAVPTEICPTVQWDQPADAWQTDSNRNNYGPRGPRGWKDEYNEWVVTRNKKGQILKISFTSENPEYWFSLWRIDPLRVLALYRELVSENVELSDLYLRSEDGEILLDYRGKPYYNPINQWNYGNEAHSDKGGAVHLTSPPNTVRAEMYLGGAATIIRNQSNDQYSPVINNCLSKYGSAYRNSDPNIGFQVNQAVRNLKHPLTLRDPVALYMQYPDFSNYKLPGVETDPQMTPSRFFTIRRGRTADEAGEPYDQILHAEFSVPPERGYTVSDITINGHQIWWGAQVAETFNQALVATVYADKKIENPDPRDKVSMQTDPSAWSQPLVKHSILKAVNTNPKLFSATVPVIPLRTVAGTTLKDIALETAQGAPNASIIYLNESGQTETGINVTVTDQYPMSSGTSSEPHGQYPGYVYVLTLEIDDNVKPGQYAVQVTNPGMPTKHAAAGNLIIKKAPVK